jgi:preprotein translocase subunit YajC
MLDFVRHFELTKLILAQAAQQAPAGGVEGVPPNPIMSMLPMVIAFFAIMYFLMIRPQQKRDRERRDMLASISKGSSVVTSGGMCGTVVGLTDSHVVLRVDDDVKIEFMRSAVAHVERDEDDSAQS